MRIEILLFAGLRERAGADSVPLELPQGATVSVLRDELARRHPALAPLLSHCRIAVDHRFAADGDPVQEGREVAIIPPVSGGHDGAAYRLSHDALALQAVIEVVTHSGAGGVATFTGNVRGRSRGKDIVYLQYEAYEPMARRALEDIGHRIEQQIAGSRVAIHHRLGRLVVGDTAVVIAASAPHRAQAFDACRQAIEWLKQEVPIWKREVATDGVEWIGETP